MRMPEPDRPGSPFGPGEPGGPGSPLGPCGPWPQLTRAPLTATAMRTRSNRIVSLRKATACPVFRMGKRPESSGGKRVGDGSTLSYKERRTGSIIAGCPAIEPVVRERRRGHGDGNVEKDADGLIRRAHHAIQ